MKDSFDKDPFAEYDKYWDDLDKQEDKVKEKNKRDYAFNDVEAPDNLDRTSTGKKAGISFGFIGIGLAFTMAYIFIDSSNTVFTPVIGIIIFGIIMSAINKNKNR